MPQRKFNEADKKILNPETLAVKALTAPEAVEVKLAILSCDFFEAYSLGINYIIDVSGAILSVLKSLLNAVKKLSGSPAITWILSKLFFPLHEIYKGFSK